ncbi:hypothetical protein IJT10_06505 [bacterium]|nr:hypothetical protein [bacterium]
MNDKIGKFLRAGVLAGAIFCSGCSLFGYVAADLTISITNDNNVLMSVEGKTNLPDDTPVRIYLKEQDKVISNGDAVVEKGSFVDTIDLSYAPGNTALTLEVIVDPTEAPDNVQRIIGEHGEFMISDQLEELGNTNCLVERLRIVLPMSKRKVAIRRIQSGDYGLGLVSLENIIESDPNDEEAKAWMAVALLNKDASENTVGSRAYNLLSSIKINNLHEPLRGMCIHWKERWDREESIARKERERKDAIAKNKAKLNATRYLIKPGEYLGGVFIGAEAKEVYSLAVPKNYPSPDATGIIKYKMPDRPITVYFDNSTSRVIEIYTEDATFSLVGNIGVGSTVSSVKKHFPDGRLRMDEDEYQPDGMILAFGNYSCPEGIIFKIKRLCTNDGLIVKNAVVGMSVVAPFALPEEEIEETIEENEGSILGNTDYPQAQTKGK